MTEISRDVSFCAHAILHPSEMLVVSDARKDPRFAENPMVMADPYIRFYAGIPLVTSTGFALGTLCVFDRTPRTLTDEQHHTLQALSRQVMAQLELRRHVAELRQRDAERAQYERQLEAYHHQLEAANIQLQAQSLTDPLTGLGNRRAFEMRMEEEVHRADRQHTPLSLVMVDIDHFKRFNDTFGHPAGDEALHAVAQKLKTAARLSDFSCRYGGEEFAVMLPNTNAGNARILAERLRKAVEIGHWTHHSV
ncbi:MAG: sensor domain-containing diguanylate cyclase, partial [Nitrospirae bacterium]|nr:sensor domain-containing diguanylate cyclase [Nitrospirota bacterium]